MGAIGDRRGSRVWRELPPVAEGGPKGSKDLSSPCLSPAVLVVKDTLVSGHGLCILVASPSTGRLGAGALLQSIFMPL